MKKGWIVKAMNSRRSILWMAVAAMTASGVSVRAQAPAQVSPATAEAQQIAEPQAPTPHAVPASPFPPVNLKNFTANSPTTAEVNDFLKVLWGFDDNLSWSVAAIQKTAAPGVTRVVVFLSNKSQPSKLAENAFYITPDGKHAISNAVMDFGEHPYAERRKTLQDQAKGPAEGAANGGLLLVEFSDLLNGKSKQAQDTINNLVRDIPQARLVFENLPAADSSYSFHAAADGVCVRKAKGDAAFFTYMQAVFNKQQGLTAATLGPALDAAVTAAGADPKSITACAASQEAKDDVNASAALGAAVGADEAPVLVVNGRILQPNSMPYETLKRIVAYQAQLDGLSVHVQPTLTELK